jgi:hypothetical protein
MRQPRSPSSRVRTLPRARLSSRCCHLKEAFLPPGCQSVPHRPGSPHSCGSHVRPRTRQNSPSRPQLLMLLPPEGGVPDARMPVRSPPPRNAAFMRQQRSPSARARTLPRPRISSRCCHLKVALLWLNDSSSPLPRQMLILITPTRTAPGPSPRVTDEAGFHRVVFSVADRA